MPHRMDKTSWLRGIYWLLSAMSLVEIYNPCMCIWFIQRNRRVFVPLKWFNVMLNRNFLEQSRIAISGECTLHVYLLKVRSKRDHMWNKGWIVLCLSLTLFCKQSIRFIDITHEQLGCWEFLSTLLGEGHSVLRVHCSMCYTIFTDEMLGVHFIE